MKRVFELSVELETDLQRVQLTQALTLNADKPLMGLNGTHGLFGSGEWWESIRNGRMKTTTVRGIIDSTYFAGQDSRWGDQVNSFTAKLDDGTVINEGIYANNKSDKKLFSAGAVVFVAYAFDELKRQPAPDGGTNYSKVVLEMAVSVRPSGQSAN